MVSDQTCLILRVPDAETELVHDVVDQLHDLFRNMSCTDGDPEASGSTQNSSSAANGGSVPRDPIAPNSFLQVNCSVAMGGGVNCWQSVLLYKTLLIEIKEEHIKIQSTLFQAVGKLNPMFEGNQQQDAHELLVTVLNTLQVQVDRK